MGKAAFEKIAAKEMACAPKISKEFANEFTSKIGAKTVEKDAYKKIVDKIGTKDILPKKSPFEQIMEFLPKTKGIKGSVTLSGEQLKLMELSGKSQGMLNAFLKRAKNPEVTLSFKSAKKGSGYSIAGLKIMDGKSVVGTGAISMTKPGAADNVIKARLSLGRKSKAVYANGFVDGSKPVNPATDDVVLASTRKAGEYDVKSRIGNSLGWNLHVAPENKEFLRVASYTGESKQVKKQMDYMLARANEASGKVNNLIQKFTSGKIA